jgi:hypothetical protein
VSARAERLAKLAEKFYIAVLDEDAARQAASTEDLWEYLHGESHIDRWVAVTYHDGETGGSHFVKTFETRQQAEDYTVEHTTDDMFTEVPIAVVDLDDDIAPHGKIYLLEKLIPIYAKE